MAKLVDVHRGDNEFILKRRQLPLVIDQNLTMIMDLSSTGLTCDSPSVRGKALEEFTKKYNTLSPEELKEAMEVSYKDIMNTLSHTVPCVGCRRSVENLYFQMRLSQFNTLEPIIVTSDGILTLSEKLDSQKLCTLLNGHNNRLSAIVEAQQRSKKSLRCSLHSLDSQRLRPVCAAWCDVWDCMVEACREEVLLIDSTTLNVTLETYLHKHRFCTECRTKVVKAYKILTEETKTKENEEPVIEKGFVPALYANIKCCYEEKHIHLPSTTEYIADLIMKAEPELLGSPSSRRERHAKTLEIAQEEVLTCLGICVYERLHKIHLRLREEECTCQVFAAVAVDTLYRSFEMAVEKKQGISRLELLYKQITKEDQAKELRKLNKKLKRRKKKERRHEIQACELCKDKDKDKDKEKDNAEQHNGYDLDLSSDTRVSEEQSSSTSSKCSCDNDDNCKCTDLVDSNVDSSDTVSDDQCEHLDETLTSDNINELEDIPQCNSLNKELNLCDIVKDTSKMPVNKSMNCKSCDSNARLEKPYGPLQNGWSVSEHSQDCGYSSENNNGACDTGSAASSLISSPYGSEVACSDGFCNHERGDCTLGEIHDEEIKPPLVGPGGFPLVLQRMLVDQDGSDEDEELNCIPMEAVLEFRSRKNIQQERERLRRTLRKNFDKLCLEKLATHKSNNGDTPRV